MFLVIDFEATCFDDGLSHHDNEIIEIGSCLLNDSFEILDTKSVFVKPVRNPVLTKFCTKLTSIRQADVDNAETFDVAWEKYRKYIENATMISARDLIFCSWGNYDKNQLKRDCDYHNLEFPFIHHVNLKGEFSKKYRLGNNKAGVQKALSMLNMQFQGNHHRGIDDAFNIARIFINEWKQTGFELNKKHIIHWEVH